MSRLQPCFGHTQRFHFLCICCIHYVNICCTHTRNHMHCRVGIVAVIHWSITSIALVTHTVDQSCWAYVVLMVWGILSSSYVEYVFKMFAYAQIHLLTHLVILLKFWWSDHPLTARPPPCNRLDRLSPRIAQKCPTIHFNLRWLQADHPALMLVNRRVWLGSHPGTHSPQNFCKSYRYFLLRYMRKLRRHVRQTPNVCPCLPSRIVQFFQPVTSKPTDCSPRKLHIFLSKPLSIPAPRSAQKLCRGGQQVNLPTIVQFFLLANPASHYHLPPWTV